MFLTFSCTPDKRTTISEKERKYADSLYGVQFDSLRKHSERLCDSIYTNYMQEVIDSIKPVRTEEIKKLFK